MSFSLGQIIRRALKPSVFSHTKNMPVEIGSRLDLKRTVVLGPGRVLFFNRIEIFFLTVQADPRNL